MCRRCRAAYCASSSAQSWSGCSSAGRFDLGGVMDSRYLLPLLALPLLLRRSNRPALSQDRESAIEADHAPPIETVELPSSFRKWSKRTASLDAIVLHCTE